MAKHRSLVADLGGTNIRFALVESGSTQIESLKKYSIKNYESLEHLIEVYLGDCDLSTDAIAAACIAIAGPIVDQAVKMTNCNWHIKRSRLESELGLERALLINDFEAIARAVGAIDNDGYLTVGPDLVEQQGPISVLGPGTGLGAALLVPHHSAMLVVPTEGGHAGLSARTDDELMIFDYWRAKGSRINREFFICGDGIVRIFEALCVNEGSDDYKNMTVANIQQSGCNQQHPLAERCMQIFCSFLGSAAGDQVLCTGSTGGMILAGGILPKFPEFLRQSAFRERFESKGAMSYYTKAVSTRLIIEEQPGLIGAAACLSE